MELEPITRQEQIIAGKDLAPITRMEKFLKEYGGGGGTSAPADWNAAEGEPGHILNRPFYAESDKREILPECQPTYVADMTGFLITQPCKLTVGEHYTVRWNGVEYASTAYVMDVFGDMPHLINDSANLETGEGLMFIIAISDVENEGAYGACQGVNGETALTLSILQEKENVTPLPDKYNPPPVILYYYGSYLYKAEDTSDTNNLLIKSELEEFVRTGRTIYISEVNDVGTVIYSSPLHVGFADECGVVAILSTTSASLSKRELFAPNTRTIE